MNTHCVPSFSVIIPTYNRASTIGRALQSVFQQSYADYELIVVDDGSSDGTPDVIAGFAEARVRYVRQANQGVSAARNAGAAQAHGRYLTFLDSDDEAMPGWLTAFQCAFADPQTGIVCCGVLRRSEIDGPSGRELLPDPLGEVFCGVTGLFLAGSFAVRRELFDAIGGYVPGLAFSENTELALRLIPYCLDQGYRIVSVAHPFVVYHRDRSQRSASPEFYRISLESAQYMLAKHGERLRRQPDTYADYCAIVGVNAARLGRYALARRSFLQAVQVRPIDWRHWMRLWLATVPLAGEHYWNRAGHEAPGGLV